MTNQKPPSKTSEEIDALRSMDLDALRNRYFHLFGHATSTKDADALREKIAQKIAFGGPQRTQSAKVQHDLAEVATRASDASAKPAGETTTKGGSKPAARGIAPTRDATPMPSPFADDPRLPKHGSVIERPYKGKTLRLKVLESGFEFDRKHFRSLSAAAQHATGAKAINGFLFWRLIPVRTPASKNAAGVKAKKSGPGKARKPKGRRAPVTTVTAKRKESR